MFYLCSVGKEIESILEKINECEKSRQTFGIERNLGERASSREEEMRKLRRSSPLQQDKDLVGLEEKTKSLVAQLLEQDSCRRVVSIVGMAGVGKTALARKVYNHADLTGHFDCRAWVYVSPKCNFKEVTRRIINQIEEHSRKSLEKLESMQDADLEETLQRKLQEKRYLVVLDDIWDEKAWECLAAAFPDEHKGSRLLMTSRNVNVPQHADPVCTPYKLDKLGKEDSWQLFLRKLCVHDLESSDSKLSSELEDIGRKIIERCDGLPLAISVIGCLLQQKRKLESEWQSVLDTISSHWASGPKGVLEILSLSYYDLPPDLKTCFLYFSFFREGRAIPTRKLYRLWIAEGLIHQKGAEVLEDVAADLLDKLINRNLVEMVAVKANEMVKRCRIHDLLRELAIAKAKEEIFLEISAVRTSPPSSKCRHLVVHSSSETHNFPEEFENSTPHLRSCIFFKLAEFEQVVNLSFASLKLLRVLDLENMNVQYIPEEIGEVILLRYLGLRGTGIKRLPISLGCLQNLQTLDIYSIDSVVEVPNVLWKLKNLQHFYVYDTNRGVPLKFDTLRNLRILCNVHVDNLIGNKLMSLNSMRKLAVWIDGSSRTNAFLDSIEKLESLVSVELLCRGRQGNPSLIGLPNLSHVRKLKLSLRLNDLPSPNSFPPKLSHLSLCRTRLAESPLPILEKLEHLSILKLDDAYVGEELVISENGFQNLKFLELIGLLHLVQVHIWRGAMPELRCLRISGCYCLEMLPEELKSMKDLERLEVTAMPKEFITRLQGVDSYKIGHVPHLTMESIESKKLYNQFRQTAG